VLLEGVCDSLVSGHWLRYVQVMQGVLDGANEFFVAVQQALQQPAVQCLAAWTSCWHGLGIS
jgi:hypothetical protein